ncbi:MAG: hypothetical protein K6T16_03190 [Candidatus Pacearchaeota archaeon]|nr:hypothetical protein [Candidatus Pacearchaeota archaeon]
MARTSNKGIKWKYIPKEVVRIVKTYTPPAYFLRIREITGLNNFLLSLVSDEDENVLAKIDSDEGKMNLFLDRIEERLGKDFKNRDKRNLAEAFILFHELRHNFQKINHRFYAGLYEANIAYQQKIEDEANSFARYALEEYIAKEKKGAERKKFFDYEIEVLSKFFKYIDGN